MILTNFLDKAKGWIVKGDTARVDFSSMLEFTAEKSSRLPEEPIEKGSFAVYNRVIDPRTITCRLAVSGSAQDLQNSIDRLTMLAENDEKITLTTPEQSYKNMMLESFDYRRDAQNGRGVLYVDLRFKEVREVASSQTTTSVEESETGEGAEGIDADDAADGSVADDIDDGEVQATPASDAEEDAADGKQRSGAYDMLGRVIKTEDERRGE